MTTVGRTIVLLLIILFCYWIGLMRKAQILEPKFESLVSASLRQEANTITTRSLRQHLRTASHLIGNPRELSRNCNVVKYGALGTGKGFDTDAIQKAIDCCAATLGGGRVYFPPGDYLTGTLHLRPNIVLYIERNATIYGSPNQSDYPAERSRWYVILAENVHNVEITGGGTVDGQAEKFIIRRETRKNVMVSWNTTGHCYGDECRPRLVGFLNSTNIRVGDVYLHQPAYWCLHVVRCSDVLVEKVKIFGDFNIPNNDGIDIEDTNNTLIVNCHIDTGDDAICPKTYNGPLFNLTVTDSWIRTKSSAVKFGSASFQDFHGLRFERLTIVDSHRGLSLQLRDEGNISDVVFANIVLSTRYYNPSWWGRAEPIYITACPRFPDTVVGSISDIHFINITATSENGVFISGCPRSILKDISFQNVTFFFTNASNKDYSQTYHDYRPGCRKLVPCNASGIFMEYASELTFKDVSINWASNLEWATPLAFTPNSVGRLNLVNFVSTTEATDSPSLSTRSGDVVSQMP